MADFPVVKSTVFDEAVVPVASNPEKRPARPTTYLVWARQARNMVRAYCCWYGQEWTPSLELMLQRLCGLHEHDEERYPFAFRDAWEELFWRQGEELRARIQVVLKTFNKDTVRNDELIQACLRPDAAGTPALEPPAVFDLDAQEGYLSRRTRSKKVATL